MMVDVSDAPIPWRELFAVSPVPTSVIDPAGRQVAYNDAYAAFLGFGADELRDLDVSKITRAEDRAWTYRYLARLVSGEIDHFETDKIYVCKDGRQARARLSTRVLRGADGVATHLIGMIVPRPDDGVMTEPGVADRLLEFGGETIALIDLNGVVRTVAGSAPVLLGFSSSFWQNRRIDQMVSPDEWERLAPVRDQVLTSPGVAVETDIVVADGQQQRTLAARIFNCTDDPLLEGIVVTVRDATEERAAMSELARRRADAEDAVDAQTRLIATVSHELRNPLHALRGLAELLEAEPLPVRGSEIASSLVRQIDGLARVTEDLLDAARLDAGKVELHPSPTQLSKLLDDVVGLGRAVIGERPIAIESRIARGVPDWVMIDGARLRQVLGNLVGNAIKFTEQGSVQVIVRSGEPGETTFSVLDTGVGIPLGEQQTVLEPFAVASTAGAGRGAGLGLSIVQRLATAMGGRIALMSTIGRGTRFDVTLPLPAAVAPLTAVPEALPDGLQVLVVEDNPVNQKLARSQLERLGLVPTIVGTGEEGLEALLAAGEGGFHVILMDHQLPGWSGIETTRRIRGLDGPLARVPIVGVSASATDADRHAFMTAGMDDFVAKPATLDDLARSLGSVLARVANASVPAVSAQPNPPEHPEADLPREEEMMNDGGPSAPDFDPEVLTRLGEDLGSDEILTDLVTQYLSELDHRVEGIVAAVAVDDRRRAAHTLKSTARLLGAERLADVCLEIEHGQTVPPDLVEIASTSRSHLEGWIADRQG
jgi:PAS domain S-box-containing protein